MNLLDDKFFLKMFVNSDVAAGDLGYKGGRTTKFRIKRRQIIIKGKKKKKKINVWGIFKRDQKDDINMNTITSNVNI